MSKTITRREALKAGAAATALAVCPAAAGLAEQLAQSRAEDLFEQITEHVKVWHKCRRLHSPAGRPDKPSLLVLTPSQVDTLRGFRGWQPVDHILGLEVVVNDQIARALWPPSRGLPVGSKDSWQRWRIGFFPSPYNIFSESGPRPGQPAYLGFFL